MGEGFHGDELEAQRAKVDDGSGRITREAFARYYVALCANVGEDDSDDDAEEREEESQSAREAFDTVADGATSVPSSKFQALMEALGTTYCEEEHRRTLRKLAPGGTVARDAFVEWYVDWVLGDGDSDDDATATDDDDDPAAESKAAATWASLTAAKEGSWKCEVCDVRNDKDASKCACLLYTSPSPRDY